MAMTAAVKDELARLPITKPCCRKAEVSSILRFASGLHIVGGRIVIEADLDTAFAARRLRKDIAEVFGHSSEMTVVRPGGLRKGNRYLVRVHAEGEQLARQTELNLSTFEFVEHGGAAGAQNPYALARAQSPLDVNAQMEVRTRTRVPGGRGGTERGREPVLTTAPPRILPAGPTRSADGPGGV